MTTKEYFGDTNTVNKPVLKFTQGNAKLDKRIAIFGLPAGHSCPFANNCKALVNRDTGKLSDGKNTMFRCYAASQEALLPKLRKARWHNFDALKKSKNLAETIQNSLPTENVIRIHVSGDFYSQSYFDAWLEVAKNNPSKIFYAYTKSVKYWIARLNQIPSNFKLNASFGGKDDNLIAKYQLKSVKVVYSEKEAKDLNLELDHDDSHAFLQDKSFALLLHGTQPAQSVASKALSALRLQGIGGYKI